MSKEEIKKSPSIYSKQQVATLDTYCDNVCPDREECGPCRRLLSCKVAAMHSTTWREFQSVVNDLDKYIQRQQIDFAKQVKNFNKEIDRLVAEIEQNAAKKSGVTELISKKDVEN